MSECVCVLPLDTHTETYILSLTVIILNWLIRSGFFFKLFFYLGLHFCSSFSIVSLSRGDSSLIAVHGLLVAVASLVSAHGL